MEQQNKGLSKSSVLTSRDVAYFHRTPWCAELLRDPAFTIVPSVTPLAKKTGEDAFFAETLRTEKAIAWCLTLFRNPPGGSMSSEPLTEIRMLYALRKGLNGHLSVVHGGAIAAIADETMGTLLACNRDRFRELGEKDSIYFSLYTANMNLKYKAPVPIPSTILALAKLMDETERKLELSCSIEDGQGKVFATAIALFVKAKKMQKRFAEAKTQESKI